LKADRRAPPEDICVHLCAFVAGLRRIPPPRPRRKKNPRGKPRGFLSCSMRPQGIAAKRYFFFFAAFLAGFLAAAFFFAMTITPFHFQ
jgi:hypothetical protein